MAQDKFKRELTTIFSADVVSYSRLMGQEAVATVKTNEECGCFTFFYGDEGTIELKAVVEEFDLLMQRTGGKLKAGHLIEL
jgi:hypothetical protein